MPNRSRFERSPIVLSSRWNDDLVHRSWDDMNTYRGQAVRALLCFGRMLGPSDYRDATLTTFVTCIRCLATPLESYDCLDRDFFGPGLI